VPDPRAAALAEYFRQRAAAFSLSADVTGSQGTAVSGMALLDAAHIAEAMAPTDPRLQALSEAGLFETMPHGRAQFTETPRIRAVIQRPLVFEAETGQQIIAHIVASIR
jgi:hypothetical protein